MITNSELSMILGGDKILYTCTQIYQEILHQGYSKFTCSDEYDFFRLVEHFEDDGYDVKTDLDTLFIEINLK